PGSRPRWPSPCCCPRSGCSWRRRSRCSSWAAPPTARRCPRPLAGEARPGTRDDAEHTAYPGAMSATSPAARPAWGVGPATVSARGVTLEAWYPQLGLGRIPAKLTGPYGVPADLASLRTTDPARGTHLTVVHTQIDLDAAPATTPDAYLRLQLLSHRIVAPGRVNLDGIEEVLPVNVWTSVGSCELEDFEETRLRLRIAGKG